MPHYPSLCLDHCASPCSGASRPIQTSLQTYRRRRRHFLLAPAIASALPSPFSHGPSAPPLCSLYCHPRPRLGAPGPSRARLYLELPEAAGDSPREQRDRLGLPCRGRRRQRRACGRRARVAGAALHHRSQDLGSSAGQAGARGTREKWGGGLGEPRGRRSQVARSGWRGRCPGRGEERRRGLRDLRPPRCEDKGSEDLGCGDPGAGAILIWVSAAWCSSCSPGAEDGEFLADGPPVACPPTATSPWAGLTWRGLRCSAQSLSGVSVIEIDVATSV